MIRVNLYSVYSDNFVKIMGLPQLRIRLPQSCSAQDLLIGRSHIQNRLAACNVSKSSVKISNTLAKCSNLLSFPRKRESSIKQSPPKAVSCFFLQMAKMLQ